MPFTRSHEILSIFDDPRNFLFNDKGNTIENVKVICPEITISVQNIRIRALIDTGSKLTCLATEFYEKHENSFSKCPKLPLTGIQAIGFDGNKSGKLKLQL